MPFSSQKVNKLHKCGLLDTSLLRHIMTYIIQARNNNPAGKLRWNDVETMSCTDVVSTLNIDADVLYQRNDMTLLQCQNITVFQRNSPTL